MNAFIGFSKRNLKLYFKDKMSVFLSMMTPIIVFLLYILFLKGTFVDAIDQACAGLSGLSGGKEADMLANAFFLAGVLGSSMITVSLNTLLTLVQDREKGIDCDIAATPMKRVQIILSYYMASLLSAFAMTAIILTVGLIILRLQGLLYLSAGDVLALYGIALLGSLSATSLFMTVIVFFRSSSTASALMVLISVAAGFVIGAYIPISQFSKGVQTCCNIFPGSGVTVLLRNRLLGSYLAHIDSTLGGVDNGAFVRQIKEVFSFQITIGGRMFSLTETVLYVLAVFVLSLIAIVLIYPKIYKRK